MKKGILITALVSVVLMLSGCATTEYMESEVGYVDKANSVVNNANSVISGYGISE